ncbi:unnamed protein product [Somion occarium]|uniref:NAD(P)-binding protein n=1 Tax=Somion occarium TaxID=3059160 RepID=A0ABP1DW30_9APHY
MSPCKNTSSPRASQLELPHSPSNVAKTDSNCGSGLKTAKALWTSSFPPKSQFSTDQIPDLTGRVVIVTGGNAGVGKETVKALLEHDAKVYMGCRSKSKAEVAMKELKEATGKDAIFLELDLSSLESVKCAAQEFLSKENELHILFLNAGVMFPPIEQLTQDGYDLQFGINVVGHHLLTKLLLPALWAGKESSPDGHARIMTTSSDGAYYFTINWDSFKDGPVRKKLGTQKMYFQSKFANVVVARELARRYGPQGIISNACHPGHLKTDLQRHVPAWQTKIIINRRKRCYIPPLMAPSLNFGVALCRRPFNTMESFLFPGLGLGDAEMKRMILRLVRGSGIIWRRRQRLSRRQRLRSR